MYFHVQILRTLTLATLPCALVGSGDGLTISRCLAVLGQRPRVGLALVELLDVTADCPLTSTGFEWHNVISILLLLQKLSLH